MRLRVRQVRRNGVRRSEVRVRKSDVRVRRNWVRVKSVVREVRVTRSGVRQVRVRRNGSWIRPAHILSTFSRSWFSYWLGLGLGLGRLGLREVGLGGELGRLRLGGVRLGFGC